jgi:CspA family cold shock protein
MVRGTVKWFNDSKGFGFVAVDDTGLDVFVHHSVIDSAGSGRRTLVEGDKVELEYEQADKGPRATLVRVI